MLIISHRGNLAGKNPAMENKPNYVLEALKYFCVEIDLWIVDSGLYLGHNEPKFKINSTFLYSNCDKLWIHCKNIEAAESLSCGNLIYLWHQNDDISITSNKFLWTYPGKQLTSKSIAVLPESVPTWSIDEAYGVCTDYPNKYKI